MFWLHKFFNFAEVGTASTIGFEKDNIKSLPLHEKGRSF
jgi:hypothetical protein